MADNDQSKIRYDDFVNSVQPDPAKPEPTIMLSGFVGRGLEGYVRIYPDPTLGTWYDLPVADVIHSMPVADSKLGGSYIWVRASADIKPGSVAPAAPAAQPQAMAAAAAPAAALQPTPTVQTHCFICPPPHLTQLAECQIQPTPTVQTNCFVCPPHLTLATVCTQINCPTQPVPCDTLLPTPQTHCFVCPPHQTQAINCPTQPVPCDTMGPTPLTHCIVCPPHQTPATVCTQIACPTHLAVCTTPQPTLHTHCIVCPPHQTLATVCTQFACPTQPVVCNIQPTLQAVCQPIFTQPGACGVLPPSVGCTQGCQFGPQQGGAPQAMAAAVQGGGLRTTWFDCHTNMAGCTVHICAQQAAPQAQALPPQTIHNSVCICPTPSAVGQCGPHPTLATICTQSPACPPHTVHNSQCICPTPSAVGQCGPHPSLATLCTLPPGCPPHQTLPAVCHQTLNIACVQPINTHFVCPTADIQCWQRTPFTVPLTPNGVFTPFGR
jgi:hypothetical protein